MSARPGWTTVVRDTASWFGGWALIFKQAGMFSGVLGPPPTNVSEILIIVGASIIGVPGIAHIISMRFGGGARTDGGQPGSPSPELPPSSPGDSSRVGEPA